MSASNDQTNDQQVKSPPFSIGIFDSGIGGLSVLQSFQTINPGYPLYYFADQAHVPYGPRSIEQIRNFSFSIAQFLIDLGAKIIVVACNTASAAALHPLRKQFPAVQFVGMEPAVKPAAETTHSGVVGVLATPATFQGTLYASVVERFAKDVVIYQNTCPGLVQEIEAGRLSSAVTRQILQEALTPMLNQKIDTIVLGCTHYPFVIPAIQAITGERVRIIDPAPAVAKQTLKIARTLTEQPSPAAQQNTILITTGDIGSIKNIVSTFQIPYSDLRSARWEEDDSRVNLTQVSNLV